MLVVIVPKDVPSTENATEEAFAFTVIFTLCQPDVTAIELLLFVAVEEDEVLNVQFPEFNASEY